MNTNNLSLTLFNAVVATPEEHPLFDLMSSGIIVMPNAAGSIKDIQSWAKENKLTEKQLNKTFYKSWSTVVERSEQRRILDQMLHYLTTYGTGHTSDYIYIYFPEDVASVPNFDLAKHKFTLIRGLSKEALVEKSLSMLQAGVAMKQDTIEQLIALLEGLGHTFSAADNIRNKEANIILADKYGIAPQNVDDLIRYIVFKATGNTMVVKNKETTDAIKASSFNPRVIILNFGLEKLSAAFNRYKPLILAFKSKMGMKPICNRLSKLSKTYHTPLPTNPLNEVTQRVVEPDEISGASTFQLARAYTSVFHRLRGPKVMAYKVRNGKTFIKDANTSPQVLSENLNTLSNLLICKLEHLRGRKVYIPGGGGIRPAYK